MSSQAPHVVLITFPAKGHINPFVFLARELSSRGLAISLLIPSEGALADIQPQDGEDEIKLVALPSTFPLLVKNRRMTMEGIRCPPRLPPPLLSFDEPLKKLLEDMMSSSSPPIAVVVDSLLLSASAIVDELNIPRYIFYTPSAGDLALVLYLALSTSLDKAKLAAEDRVRVPGLPPLRWREVASHATGPLFASPELFRRHLLESRGILMNTSYSIEGKVINELRRTHPSLRTNFIPVGTLGVDEPSPLRSELESKCQEWLDSQAHCSVVFVSFGSWAGLGRKQILDLAKGLESSNFSFLWLLPPALDDEDGDLESRVPEGFLARTRGRGLVLEDWAPQRLILSHPSVAAFVTHCGWNSVVECITLAGVPMLGWPFCGDQPIVCRWLVEALGVAVDIVEDEDGTASAAEVERALRQVMTYPDVRQRASKLKQRVREEGGNELEDLVLYLKQSLP